MHLVAVVPIFMSAGAAVLPTVAAAAASVLALLFKPRELFRLCRRRPMAACSAGALASLAILLLVWWIETPAPAHPVARVPARPDWARVAQDIIAQAPLHPAATAAAGEAPPPPPLPAPAAARPQDFTRCLFLGGASPAHLAPLWTYRPEATMFISTPAVAGQRIFAAGCASDLGGYTGLLACLDADRGKIIWQIAALNNDDLKPFFSSPALSADGRYVVIGQGLHDDKDCSLLCFEAETGKLHWAAKTTLHIESSPAIFGDMAVVGAGAIEGRDGRATGDPGFVFAVRISDGQELWRQALNDPESEPVIDDAGMVYIGSGFNGNAVAAIRSGAEGELKAQGLPRLAWKTAVDYPVTGPLTLAGDRVIAGGGNGDLVHSNVNAKGQVLALDRKTGAIVWKVSTDDAMLGSMACRDDAVICPCRSGEILALSVKDGKLLWRTRISGKAPVLAGCAFTDQRIYALSSDGYLALLDPKTGVVLEKVFVNDAGRPGMGLCLSSPVVAGGRVIVGTETGGLKCLAGAGGTP